MSELLWNDVNAKLPDEGVQVLCTGFCRDVDDNEHAVVTEKRWHAVAHRDQFNNWKPETHGATDGVDNLYAPTHWMQIAPLQQETDKDGELKTLYYELLMSVGNKYPNETRHQTALRYIINAERITGEAKAALPQKDSKI